MTPLEQVNLEVTTTIVALAKLLVSKGVITAEELRASRMKAISEVEQNFARKRDASM